MAIVGFRLPITQNISGRKDARICLTLQGYMRSLKAFFNAWREEGMMPRMVKNKSAVKKPRAKTTAKIKTAAKKLKAANGAVNVGSAAPAFAIPATRIGEARSATLKGKPYVLYFYPKDDTSGCTAEACGFRDAVPAFGKLGLTVIGVSKDSLASHEKFAKKHGLSFPLASDESGKVCAAFGTWVKKSMYGRSYMGIERSTFLVDAKGIVRAAWRKVSVPGHVDEVKKAAANL
jgi:peroxiredoxin Q/BCP